MVAVISYGGNGGGNVYNGNHAVIIVTALTVLTIMTTAAAGIYEL